MLRAYAQKYPDAGYSGVDLLRSESLGGLDPHTRAKFLKSRYSVLVTQAPLAPSTPLVPSQKPLNHGPPVADCLTPWWNLFVMYVAGAGAPSFLIPIGSRLPRVPEVLLKYADV